MLSSGPASAFNLNDYLNQDINYLGNETAACATGTRLNLVGSNYIEMTLNVLMDEKLGEDKMSLEQAAGVIGNLIYESGDVNLDPAAEEFPGQERGGYGIAQWTGGRWRGPDGLKTYAQDHNVDWKDLSIQLQFLMWEVGLGDPWNNKPGGSERRAWQATLNETTVDAATETWMLVFERPNQNPRINRLDKRQDYARAVFDRYKGEGVPEGGIDSGVSIPSACSGASGAVQGDIVATARGFAWDHRVEIPYSSASGYGRSESKPSFVTAASRLTNDYHTAYFTDCGVFVATVMISSGVDPSYPRRGTDAQYSYLQSSDKYQIIRPSSEADLQPGDILIRPGHTYIYTGAYTAADDGQEYKAVGASLYTRPPSGHYFYLSDGDDDGSGSYIAARFIGG